MLKRFIYQIIFQDQINWILRNLNRFLKPIFPNTFRIPPSGVLKFRSSEGKTFKVKTNESSYVTQKLFWEGHEHFEYADIFIRLINKVDTFYDIGANIGFYSLLASVENNNIQVVGFEPARGPLHYFKENVRINDFKNIRIESLALSEQKGEIDFYELKNVDLPYLEYNLSGEGNAGSLTTGRDFVIRSVATGTLDEYVLEQGDTSIDLMKLDTEGTEHLILSKAIHVLSTMKPIVICETLFNTIESELERIMFGHGYECYNHVEGGLKKVDSIIREVDDGVTDCFFVHPSKLHWIEEFLLQKQSS